MIERLIDWDEQNAIFRAANERQARLRDLILKPRYYDRFHPGAYEFIAWNDPRAAGGVDTIASGKSYDEKIVTFPRNGVAYKAFALETMSCTVEGRERAGWMKTGTFDYLFYCFTDRLEQCLDCYRIEFAALQRWFYEREQTWPLRLTEEVNRGACRVVPIAEVCAAVPSERMRFARPAHYDQGRYLHYCDCGVWGAFGVGAFPRQGIAGTWYCLEHKPIPQPIPPRPPRPPPPPPAQGDLFAETL